MDFVNERTGERCPGHCLGTNDEGRKVFVWAAGWRPVGAWRVDAMGDVYAVAPAELNGTEVRDLAERVVAAYLRIYGGELRWTYARQAAWVRDALATCHAGDELNPEAWARALRDDEDAELARGGIEGLGGQAPV